MMGKSSWMVKLFFSMKPDIAFKFIKGIIGAKKYYKTASEGTAVDMKSLLKCAHCPNMCRFECPSLRVTHKEMYAPAVKARIAYLIERGDLDPADPHTAEVPYLCVNCDGCRHWCPMDISTGQLLKAVRADLVARDCVSEDLKDFDTRVLESGTMFSSTTFSSHPEFDVRVEKPDVFYFMGCVMAEKKPEAVMANIAILKKAGIRFSTYASERCCCGGPSNTVGFRATMRHLAEKNLALFAKAGAETIITDCPACADTLRNTYKAQGIKHDYKVLTTVEFYKILVEQGTLKLEKPVNEAVTYHDPCIVARGFDDVDLARAILGKIPGLVLKEPFLTKAETQCCGMGGVSHVHHPAESEAIGMQRYDQLVKTGASAIVTSCPACEEGFLIAHDSSKEKRRIMDIAEIIARSAGAD
ncbi:MAG: (Fe-S)-binding protein [Candidatus Sigynarchaeota archaeon]